MTPEKARLILENYLNGESDAVDFYQIKLPDGNLVIYGENSTEWTFKELLKIAYDL